jgi:hypothetical protein
VILLFATLAFASPLTICNNAKTKLASYVATLPASCTENADCDALALAADTCAPAFPLRKDAPVTKDSHLKSLQAAVGKACAPIFRKRGTCSAPPVTAGCEGARCVDLRLGKHRE